MPHTPKGWIVSTLADYQENGSQLTIFCTCGHSLAPSLPKLIERLGPDFDVVENREALLHRFVCNDCGARSASLTITPPYPRPK